MNKKAFTLTEMLVVIVIISGLMFLVVPNLSNSKNNVENQTCEAYILLVESQIQAYKIDKGVVPTIDQLVTEKYIQSNTCPNGELLEIIGEDASIVSTP